MDIFDNIRELIGKCNKAISELDNDRTGEADIDNSQNDLIKGFKMWLEKIQVDLVDGVKGDKENENLNAIYRLESLLKVIDVMKQMKNINNKKIEEMSFKSLLVQSILEEAKPSAGLSKKQKSDVVKKAKKGEDIGKKGKGFEKLAKKAGGGEKGEKIAAAAMWKNIKREGSENESDHEVSMAKNSLKSIMKSVADLMNKLGDEERNIPGWIQDHITNAENFIDQAAQGFHEIGDDENESDSLIQPVDENDEADLNEGVNPMEALVDMLVLFPLTAWASFTWAKSLLAIPKFKDKYNAAKTPEEKKDVLMSGLKYVVDPSNIGSYTDKVDEKKLSKVEKSED